MPMKRVVLWVGWFGMPSCFMSRRVSLNSGRIKSRTEIEAMAHEHGEIRIYVLEVCRNCGWNHLVESYVVGDGVPRKPPRRQRTVEDDD